jgi:hypothetical protein
MERSAAYRSERRIDARRVEKRAIRTAAGSRNANFQNEIAAAAPHDRQSQRYKVAIDACGEGLRKFLLDTAADAEIAARQIDGWLRLIDNFSGDGALG